MKGIQALNPSSSNFLDEESIVLLAKAYDADMEDLKHELHQTRRILSRKKSDGQKVPVTLMEFTRFLEPFKEVFFELFRLTKIAVVLPVSSASCERSFSTLKLVKTHLRSTMSDSRLSNLAVLSIESERSKALDMDAFIKRFSVQHGNPRIQHAADTLEP
uniref:HAT C-terminal dimerisation domain-containing protein n=1 Tax=Sinocyclocheilus rhinocerous TaxID=307959 RepID=A0A673HC17_9TELE